MSPSFFFVQKTQPVVESVGVKNQKNGTFKTTKMKELT